MTHMVTQPCVGCRYTDCVVVCPVECFYEGEKMLYIHPEECIDCEACVPECPVEAIFYEDDLPHTWAAYQTDNVLFFANTLPGCAAPVGSPGDAMKIGRLGVDTLLVAQHPRQDP